MTSQHANQNSDTGGYSWDRDKFEYQMAQEMLRHYDSLNWQIGSILIAGTLVLTALMFNKDTIALLNQSFWPAVSILIIATLLSASVLGAWWLWFRRHRGYYNLRNNEVLHRIELRRGMFHHLGNAEADLLNSKDIERREKALTKIREAKRAAYAGFQEFYKPVKLNRPSGFVLATLLAGAIPLVQALGTILLVVLHHFRKLY